MFFDPMSFIILAPALLLGLWAQMRVKSAVANAEHVPEPLSGAAAARHVLDSAGLNDVERSRRARELLNMEKDVQRKQREYREDLMQRKNEERANIAQKAYKIIEQIAAQEQLDVVIYEAGWFNPRIDITDKILKQLDK